ncbi:hypothetical protein EVAR_103738_1 [Eumeta japonica]|uniref:Uncharacterized protein n=1 Tax=Eumeta variegata TaxID=151549 RepID=A0A4C1ZN11_EUMVA|nr:hypothetical protein EVAR_103738_1 [Eumeta japonica]
MKEPARAETRAEASNVAEYQHAPHNYSKVSKHGQDIPTTLLSSTDAYLLASSSDRFRGQKAKFDAWSGAGRGDIIAHDGAASFWCIRCRPGQGMNEICASLGSDVAHCAWTFCGQEIEGFSFGLLPVIICVEFRAGVTILRNVGQDAGAGLEQQDRVVERGCEGRSGGVGGVETFVIWAAPSGMPVASSLEFRVGSDRSSACIG